MDLPQTLRTLVTVNDAMYVHKNDAFPLRHIFALKKIGESQLKRRHVSPRFLYT